VTDLPKPLLAVSMGDPVGIGPEVVVKALSVSEVRDAADLVVYGDAGALARAAEHAQVPIEIREVASCEAARGLGSQVPVLAVSRIPSERLVFGQPCEESDRAQLLYIERAMDGIRSGAADAIVTAPINKASIARAGSKWPGHTEMLAQICETWSPGGGPLRPVMMLSGNHLRVVPLTSHVPLGKVPSLVTPELVLHCIRVINDSFLRFFGRHRPRIAVAGLNPHAGENGLFGDEERVRIEPAIAAAREDGALVFGPLPPDTVFRRAVEGEFDVVLGMYHDQALIPIKLLDFDRAVNVTLGLPVIRTSVDHGTAYDLAGKGVASAGSMIAALLLASSMVRERRRAE
jgi:4-hydroxythreonine-4-phosphate dehydrogenase